MNEYVNASKLIKSVNNYQEGAKAALNPIDGDADYFNGKIDACKDIKEFIIFLQQEMWRPNEEQMEALKYVTKQWEDGKGVACPSSFKYHEITELYNQLKKLGVREEPEYYQHFDPDC